MSNIGFIAPSPIRGSGGVARIYTFAKALSDIGHQCDVYVFDSGTRRSTDLSNDALNFYGIDKIRIIPGLTLDKKYDLLIATRWDTAKTARDLPSRKKAYLVQDFEACFNPVGDGTILAENSYLYGLQTITYGRWLALKLHTEYGNSPYYCNFATNLGTFKVLKQMKDRFNKPPSICFIYQHDKPRRCPLLGIEALGIVKHIRPDVELYFVGSNETPKLWYDYSNAGLLSLEGLNDLYNRCHVGLCLSSSNPSCNPFDMMAAGLPSVDLYRENNLFDIPSGGVLLAHQTPESLAEAILHLISSKETLLRMSDFGVEFMKSRSATGEIYEFLSAIEGILSEKSHSFNPIAVAQQRFAGQAIVAEVHVKPSVVKHVEGQFGKFIGLIDDSAFSMQIKASFKSHNFVTALNQGWICHPLYNNSLKFRLRRFVKRLIGESCE